MSDARRRKLVRLLVACIAIGPGIALVGLSGCGNRTPIGTKKAGEKRDIDAIGVALTGLEKDSGETNCRTVLATTNAAISQQNEGPEPQPEQIQSAAKLLRLSPAEIEQLSQRDFAPVDGDYLSNCLLVRDGVRSLEINDYSAEKQASLLFAWVCRQIYIRQSSTYLIGNQARVVGPAPPWWVLEAGSGYGLERAYVFLEALRQLNLDACLVGPPTLAESPSFIPQRSINEKPTFAPVRAVAVAAGSDILLFDPWTGTTLGKLAVIRENPATVKEWLSSKQIAPDEPKKWELFLAIPVNSLSPRMEWLQRQMKAINAVQLHVNAANLLARFNAIAAPGGLQCSFWNPAKDDYSLGHLVNSYYATVRGAGEELISLKKQEFRELNFPREFIPELRVGNVPLAGAAKYAVESMFREQFKGVFLANGSPRDQLIRGKFESASAALQILREQSDVARERIRKEKLNGVVEAWANEANNFFADVQRAELDGNPQVIADAKANLNHFLGDREVSKKMVEVLQRDTALLLSAESCYLIAQLVQEKAERIQARFEQSPQTDNKSNRLQNWKEAASWWRRYLENYPELKPHFADRDQHARIQMTRCNEMVADGIQMK